MKQETFELCPEFEAIKRFAEMLEESKTGKPLKELLEEEKKNKAEAEEMRKLKQAARSRLQYVKSKAKKHGLALKYPYYTNASLRISEATAPCQLDDWNEDTDDVLRDLNDYIRGKAKQTAHFIKI